MAFYVTNKISDLDNIVRHIQAIAAVSGQIAGAYYGESGIPSEWLGKLYMRDMITGLADRLAK